MEGDVVISSVSSGLGVPDPARQGNQTAPRGAGSAQQGNQTGTGSTVPISQGNQTGTGSNGSVSQGNQTGMTGMGSAQQGGQSGMTGMGSVPQAPGQPSGSASGTSGPGPAAGTTTQPATASSGSGAGTAAGTAGTDTFLKLLVAQLSNQDPMQPMDNQSFITELAQFNSVEQMINLNQSVQAQAGAQQAAQGVAMLGKTITYSVPGIGQASSTTGQGIVTAVNLANGQVQLQVNNKAVPLSQVTAVSVSG